MTDRQTGRQRQKQVDKPLYPDVIAYIKVLNYGSALAASSLARVWAYSP